MEGSWDKGPGTAQHLQTSAPPVLPHGYSQVGEGQQSANTRVATPAAAKPTTQPTINKQDDIGLKSPFQENISHRKIYFL